MDAVQFESVSKHFSVGRPWGVKDALLGSRGNRHQIRRVCAISEVSFSVSQGEAVGLLGHNGSGKSTTLKLLAGTIRPSAGKVRSSGRIAPLLELGAGFHSDLTGRENVFLNAAFLGVRRSYVKKHLNEIIEFSGVESFIDTPVRFYSSGMSARLGFSVAVHVEPEIVLMDEVLAVGDAGFQERCFARMRQLKDEGRTIILVTHSFQQAVGFCSRGLVLDHGQLTFDGPIAESRGAFEGSTHLS